MKTRLITAVLFVFGIAGLTACANTDTDTTKSPDDGEVRSSGMALTTDTLADTDVAQMQFDIQGVDCQSGQATGFSETRVKDLEDMMLPGGIAKFENAPFDEESEHLFADAFFLVDAGCYDVVTTPLDDAGQPSSDCQPAHRDRVSVEDGQTTEILLINQCEGKKRGGLDVISSINHPPEVSNLEFQKFRSSCPPASQARQVCVTAEDPDNDPLEFTWSATSAGKFQGDIVETTRNQRADGTWESCARLTTNRVGDYSFEVSIFDLDGNGKRMEQVLADQDPRDAAQSRDSIQFPIYSGVACQGRTASIMMAIGDHRSLDGANDLDQARRLIRQTTRWASPLSNKQATDILYVLDDNNRGEHLPQDRNRVLKVLRNNFATVDAIPEPNGGIRDQNVDGYDLVWFANPGWPMDDVRSRDVLRRFSKAGGGVILEGDDMGRHAADPKGLEFFTGLEFLDNGTETCGVTTDNYSGNSYGVQFSQEPISAIDGLRGSSLQYDNDIDHVRRLLEGERVLATASFSRGDCTYQGPAVTTKNPIDF